MPMEIDRTYTRKGGATPAEKDDHVEAEGAGALVCRLAGIGDQWDSLKAKLGDRLSENRYIHSQLVADTAVAMGRAFGGDLVKLALAGLLHDGAKELGNEKLLAIGEAEGLITDLAEKENPYLLHGPVGAWMAQSEWEITDSIILEAIRLHTTGEAGMSKEACIVFMADLIEPKRAYRGVEVLRQLCREDLQAGMIEAITQTYTYLARGNRPLHQGMARCLAWLKEERGIEWKVKN